MTSYPTDLEEVEEILSEPEKVDVNTVNISLMFKFLDNYWKDATREVDYEEASDYESVEKLPENILDLMIKGGLNKSEVQSRFEVANGYLTPITDKMGEIGLIELNDVEGGHPYSVTRKGVRCFIERDINERFERLKDREHEFLLDETYDLFREFPKYESLVKLKRKSDYDPYDVNIFSHELAEKGYIEIRGGKYKLTEEGEGRYREEFGEIPSNNESEESKENLSGKELLDEEWN